MTKAEIIQGLKKAMTICDSVYAYDMDKYIAEAIKALEQEPTTKNDLGVDAVSRQAILDIAKASKSNWIDNSILFKRVNELPSITPQNPFIATPCISSKVCEHDRMVTLNKIRAEIVACLKALDDIEKSGLNIYLSNEMSGRRLTYQQCLEFIDKYKAETEAEDGSLSEQR